MRDKIDENPQKGFLNAYIINIYGNETYQFGIAWWNENGSISEKVWFAKGGNTTPLDTKDYSVSGNRIIFYIPSSALSDVKDEYILTVSTYHIEISSNAVVTDSADYIYKPYKYPEEPGENSYLLPLLVITLIIVIVALVFSVLKKRD